MQIPTATDARRAVNDGRYEKAQKQAGEIAAAIKRAIGDGATEITRQGFLERAVMVELESRGYKVKEQGDQRDGDFTVISWA